MIHESDADYDGGVANGQWSQRVDARLARQWDLRRGSITAGAGGSYVSYPEAEGLNQFSYDLQGTASYALTRRLAFTASDALSSGYAQDSAVLLAAGQLLPRVVTRTNSATAGLLYALSRRTEARASVSSATVLFQEGVLTDRTSATAQGMVSTRIHSSHALGAVYAYRVADGSSGDMQSLMGSWEANAGRTGRLQAMAGVIAYSLEGEGQMRYSPGGSAGVTVTAARYHSLGAMYASQVEPSYGSDGTFFTHRFAGSYAASVARLTLGATASYSHHTDVRVPDRRHTGTNLRFSVGYAVASTLNVAGGYDLWTRTETGLPRVTSYRASISLSYGFQW